jgi:asparaginyl-tRNA synthetase
MESQPKMELEYKQAHVDISKIYKDPTQFIGKVVTVNGWIKLFRKGKSVSFVRLSDGTSLQTLQIVFDAKSSFDDLLKRGKTGVSIKVVGLIVESLGKEQSIEMQAQTYQIYGDVVDADTYPIAKSEQTMEYLRTVPHLRYRTDTHACVGRIKSSVKYAVAEFFKSHGFAEIQVPCITDNECESGANPFTVTTVVGDDHSKDFFKKHCYLTVSGQLHLEAVVLGGLQKAWTTTTAFRAEPSMSPLHMAEFWMTELEFCFGDIYDNIRVNELCIKHCISKVLEECYSDLEFLQEKFKPTLIETLKKYATTPFIITTHAECVKQMLVDIEKGTVKIDPNKTAYDLCVFKDLPAYDDDLTKDHEKYITGIMYNGLPVFVREYPAKIKAFYMPKVNKGDQIERVDNFDMLMPEIGEVVGGSMRETDYDELKSRMIEMGVNPETLQFYLDLRKYGTVPHGGSGIGFDRLMLAITGMGNIRDMVPFPRSYETCYY